MIIAPLQLALECRVNPLRAIPMCAIEEYAIINFISLRRKATHEDTISPMRPRVSLRARSLKGLIKALNTISP